MSMELISREEVKKLLNEGWYRGVYPSSAIMSLPTVKAIPIEVVEQILSEISEEIGTKQWEDYDYCSGLIKAKNIINKAIREVEQ